MFNVIPIFRKVDAVYFDEDTEEIFRVPVLGIFWDEKSDLQFFDSDVDGIMDVPDTSRNFVGYEFDGDQQDWKEGIKRAKKRIESDK